MPETTAPALGQIGWLIPAGRDKPVAGRRIAGMGRFCVIEDPAGALASVYQP